LLGPEVVSVVWTERNRETEREREREKERPFEDSFKTWVVNHNNKI
jgi:hypothetical protein